MKIHVNHFTKVKKKRFIENWKEYGYLSKKKKKNYYSCTDDLIFFPKYYTLLYRATSKKLLLIHPNLVSTSLMGLVKNGLLIDTAS